MGPAVSLPVAHARESRHTFVTAFCYSRPGKAGPRWSAPQHAMYYATSDLFGRGGRGVEELRRIAHHDIDSGRYRSYLVRLWRDAPGCPWRCQVTCVGTARQQRFAGLAEMLEFLVADAASASEGQEGNSKTSDIQGESPPAGRPSSTLDHDAPDVGDVGAWRSTSKRG
jgi:hypothetical protein